MVSYLQNSFDCLILSTHSIINLTYIHVFMLPWLSCQHYWFYTIFSYSNNIFNKFNNYNTLQHENIKSSMRLTFPRNNKNGWRLLQYFQSTTFSFSLLESPLTTFFSVLYKTTNFPNCQNVRIALNSHINGSTTHFKASKHIIKWWNAKKPWILTKASFTC